MVISQAFGPFLFLSALPVTMACNIEGLCWLLRYSTKDKEDNKITALFVNLSH